MFKVHFDLEYHSPVAPGVSSQSFDVSFIPGDFQRYFLNLNGHCICVTLGDVIAYGDKSFKKCLDDDTEYSGIDGVAKFQKK